MQSSWYICNKTCKMKKKQGIHHLFKKYSRFNICRFCMAVTKKNTPNNLLTMMRQLAIACEPSHRAAVGRAGFLGTDWEQLCRRATLAQCPPRPGRESDIPPPLQGSVCLCVPDAPSALWTAEASHRCGPKALLWSEVAFRRDGSSAGRACVNLFSGCSCPPTALLLSLLKPNPSPAQRHQDIRSCLPFPLAFTHAGGRPHCSQGRRALRRWALKEKKQPPT